MQFSLIGSPGTRAWVSNIIFCLFALYTSLINLGQFLRIAASFVCQLILGSVNHTWVVIGYYKFVVQV